MRGSFFLEGIFCTLHTFCNQKVEILALVVYLFINWLLFESGGAQAIAAMAYGTETVPKVDKLCGPGNSFVTMAKMLVQNDSSASVSIDMPAGPSEVMVCIYILSNIT